MARILHQDLFGWEDVKLMPDLERLKMVLDQVDDEALVRALETDRGRGRNDFPVRAMWNMVVLFPLTGHRTWAEYCRELGRNRDLMALCGFPVGNRVPSAAAVCRFLKKLKEHQFNIDELIHQAIDRLGEELPDFGEHLAVDSQAVNSVARKASDKMRKDGTPDGRGEHDAENSRKVSLADGEKVEFEWFGFKNHLLCDAKYQLPLIPLVAVGTSSDMKHLKPLIEGYVSRHPKLARRIKDCAADMGYDSAENILDFRSLTDAAGELLCPTRKLWKKPDFVYADESGKEIPLKILPGKGKEDLCYDEDGQLYCCYEVAPDKWQFHPMALKGYERDRQALKYACPAAHYGGNCPGREECEKGCGRSVRVKLSTDPRIFVPTPRHSLKFVRLYKRRTAVERINGLFKDLFDIKDMKVRGLINASLRVSLMVLTVLTMALARIKNNQKEKMTSIAAAA